ncbi:MAG: GTP-binding protein [Bacteroidales bacterium]|jgi:GTP-binding protein|nr:GTP-binding protein [Bacteroidales bacterium]
MIIENIEFLCSSPSLRDCPRQELPEFAFIGRSNVGKSSLINMIVNRKGLAKVSGTPGKTRLINHFLVKSSIQDTRYKIQDTGSGAKQPFILHRERSDHASCILHPFSWFLVDLPGYGFAKLSKVQREKFEGVIRNYLENRENLALTFLLIDARLEPQKIDLEFMNWLGDHDIPFVILFTKIDKLSKSQLTVHLNSYKNILSGYWEELPLIISTSAKTRYGCEEVLGKVGEVLMEIK